MMGTWGTGIYENDDAADWAYGVTEGGLDYVAAALVAVHGLEHVDGWDGAAALAAADVIVRLQGRAGADAAGSEAVVAWADAQPVDTGAHLIDAAQRAVERVAAADSELTELWEQVGDDDEAAWRDGIADLLERLGA